MRDERDRSIHPERDAVHREEEEEQHIDCLGRVMYVCDEEDSSRMVGVQISDRKQLQQSPACRWK